VKAKKAPARYCEGRGLKAEFKNTPALYSATASQSQQALDLFQAAHLARRVRPRAAPRRPSRRAHVREAGMSLEKFEAIRFHAKTTALINQANKIIAEYQVRGFILTLRQLFYQFVSRALLANKQSEYKRLGTVIKNGRRAGLIDWESIEDRTRSMRFRPWWDNPAGIVSGAAEQYREDLWRDQDFRPEVWIEKDALLGVIEGICDEFRVPYFACRGNNSESEIYKAGKRFEAQLARGVTPIVLHLGDHDPNGLDMTRDNRDRLAMFARRGVEVRRLALNMDQIERYRPPPNFAKETDSRFKAYAKKFGPDSWELDALDPTVIADLIRTAIEGMLDGAAWDAAKADEAANRSLLESASDKWASVEKFLMRASS
jgi:hypothetical protein